VNTTPVSATTSGNITATYSGVTKSATLTVKPPAPAALTSLTLNPSTVVASATSKGTVNLTAAAPAGGAVVALTSSNSSRATIPASVTVPAGASSATFNVGTATTNKKTSVTITASYGGVNKSATLTIIRR
jgi:hypothetical protein